MADKEREHDLGDSANGKRLVLHDKIPSTNKKNIYITWDDDPVSEEIDEWEKGKFKKLDGDHSHTVFHEDDSSIFPVYHRDMEIPKSRSEHKNNSRKKVDIHKAGIDYSLNVKLTEIDEDCNSDYQLRLYELKTENEKVVQDFEKSKNEFIKKKKKERLEGFIDKAESRKIRIKQLAQEFINHPDMESQKRELDYINPIDADGLIKELDIFINKVKSKMSP